MLSESIKARLSPLVQRPRKPPTMFLSILAAFASIGLVAAQQLQAGIYQISINNGSQALAGSASSGSPVTASQLSASLDQYWQLAPVPGLGKGNWTMLNMGTNLSAAVASVTTNAPVISESSSALHVFTQPTDQFGSMYQILAAGSSVGSLSLTTSSSGVTLQPALASAAQAWNFRLISPVPGQYNIQSSFNEIFNLDVCDCNIVGTQFPIVSVAPISGSLTQKWLFELALGGFTIFNVGMQASMVPASPLGIGTLVFVDPTVDPDFWVWQAVPSDKIGDGEINIARGQLYVTPENPGAEPSEQITDLTFLFVDSSRNVFTLVPV
ncbi:hypothetical protein B0H19DRAFT_1372641 [Mycena capillaripes]|nr:hypothetical protein B0H19DRAFT_1372641 [Mycena capillaripes]